MRALVRLGLAVLPLPLIAIAFVLVLRAGSAPAPLARTTLPDEAYERNHCTWYCHNHGCPHRPKMGTFFAGDEGLFGWTVDALHAMGDRASPGSHGVGYGIVNLAVFCAAWPAGMYVLYLVALRQRLRIRELRGRARAIADAQSVTP